MILHRSSGFSRLAIASMLFAFFAFPALRAQAKAPQRVMSLNLCPDQLLLEMLPPERITSVTYIAHTSNNAKLRARASKVGINYGLSEEVLAQNPDLVISGNFSTSATRAMLKRIGYPLVELPSANTFDAIREQTLFVGKLVGAEQKAAAMVAEMDATLAQLARTMPKRKISVVAWNGSSVVPGQATLFNEILTRAGGINLAAGMNWESMTSFDIEQLVATRPELIAYGVGDSQEAALRSQPLKHPLVQRLYGDRQITYPENVYTCGIPQSAQAIIRLRTVMQKALAQAKPRP